MTLFEKINQFHILIGDINYTEAEYENGIKCLLSNVPTTPEELVEMYKLRRCEEYIKTTNFMIIPKSSRLISFGNDTFQDSFKYNMNHLYQIKGILEEDEIYLSFINSQGSSINFIYMGGCEMDNGKSDYHVLFENSPWLLFKITSKFTPNPETWDEFKKINFTI